MDRRSFLTGVTKKIPATGKIQDTRYRNTDSGLTAYSGNWTRNEISHLLKRTMFGAKKSDIDYFLGMSASEAVDELLNAVIPSPSPPLRDYGLISDEDGVLHDDKGVAQGQTWVNDYNTLSDPVVKGSINRLRIESLRKWWAGLIVHQNRSIWEKMVLFWHHHFSVQVEEVDNATMMWKHHNLLRTNALGNVKQLVKEVTIDPAMLIHLNGYLNSKQAPDENYAREMQELFTVGKGPDSAYTENDVITAARVLTGWRIDNTYTAYLDSNSHDTGSKTFSSFYNNTTISGSGQSEVSDLVDMIYSTTEAARFFCRKLYTWFVYYQVDETVETNIIVPLGEMLISNGFDVKPVLSALLKSEHFFDPENQACSIKSPLDMIAGTLREFNVPFPPYTDYINGYPLFYAVYGKASAMQETLLQPPDVSGWQAYYQDPMFYEIWVNSNSLPKRADFTDALVEDNVIDYRAFAGNTSNPADPNQLIDEVTELLLRYPLSGNSKLYIKNRFLINNTGNDATWTNAWNSNNNAVINSSLSALFKFMMNLPEFHLC
ncbi:MAG: DUF1800 family protein [Terrimonas sp.]|nr:DUF1800 family protein [Terrimonas sp.]